MPDRREHVPGNGRDSLSVGWGDKFVSMKGSGVILGSFAVLAIIAAGGYMAWRIESAVRVNTQAVWAGVRMARAEHANVEIKQDRLSCMVSLDPAERTAFRKNYRPGLWSIHCPWLAETTPAPAAQADVLR